MLRLLFLRLGELFFESDAEKAIKVGRTASSADEESSEELEEGVAVSVSESSLSADCDKTFLTFLSLRRFRAIDFLHAL